MRLSTAWLCCASGDMGCPTGCTLQPMVRMFNAEAGGSLICIFIAWIPNDVDYKTLGVARPSIVLRILGWWNGKGQTRTPVYVDVPGKTDSPSNEATVRRQGRWVANLVVDMGDVRPHRMVEYEVMFTSAPRTGCFFPS